MIKAEVFRDLSKLVKLQGQLRGIKEVGLDLKVIDSSRVDLLSEQSVTQAINVLLLELGKVELRVLLEEAKN